MAYKQNPGRGPMMKTGKGIPSALLQVDPKDGQFKKELETVRKRDSEGGFLNTLQNIGTGLSHGWGSIGYDSKSSGGKKGDLTYDSGGNKDIGDAVSSAVSTAYNYATGNIPKKVTKENKQKKVRAAQTTYLD
tara:strand:+ start:1892 stop:2290 length:399 start_codon:yes stop_codon:yes gene_type:complete